MVPHPASAAVGKGNNKKPDQTEVERQEKVAELFEKGSRAREEGDFVTAANDFHEAYMLLPVENSEARASMMLIEVEVLRSAYNLDRDPIHLCSAERSAAAYIEEVKHNFGDQEDVPRDVEKAREVREQLRGELDGLRPEGEFDCDNPEHLAGTVSAPEPEPEKLPQDEISPSKRRKLQLAGGITTGIGILGLGLMTSGLIVGWRAERAGDAKIEMAEQQGMTLTPDDPELSSITARGQAGNILAVVGGAIAVMGLAAGIPTLIIGTRPRQRIAGIFPILTQRVQGVGLTLQF